MDTGWCAYGVVYPTFVNGVDTVNWREFITKGKKGDECAEEHTARSIVRLDRKADAKCEPGYKLRLVDGVYECYRVLDPCDDITAGNPITCGSGNKRQSENDYRSAGASPLEFSRIYNSFGSYRAPGHPDRVTSSMGDLWRHTYDRYVFAISPDSHAMASVVRPDGQVKLFDHNGQELVSPGQTREYLEKMVDDEGGLTGWRLHTSSDALEVYDDTGRLQSITDRRGVTQTLTYSDATTPVETALEAGLLVRVEDSFGKAMSFTYNEGGLLASLTDPSGAAYDYEYDGVGNLITVTYPSQSSDAVQRQYHYENTQFEHALTGITDENGVRFSTYGYDSEGRAISTEHAGGVEKYTLTYGANSSTLTDPLGEVRTFQYETIKGVRRGTGASQPCPTCGGNASASSTYDDNGFLTSRTDFSGITTTYIRDSRGREVSRTEAAGTDLERSITTVWHAQLNLPLQINEPGRRTDYSYDANGNRLSQTITDTETDTSRTTTWTYTTLGQVEAVDGPRTDVSDITTYSYDSQGDLTSTINAIGQVTQITDYDAHGNPLSMLDDNGVVTQMSYDERQRLTSKTVAGATTIYEYDPAGQLIRVTQPNGAALSYIYDDAHRLIGIEDSMGNRMTYTLDAMGNRTQEEVFDPEGVLRRSQSQVYDQLSRLKEIHGANGQLTEYEYDANGNRTATTAAGMYSTLSQFDALERLIKVTDANNGETLYTYDALGHLTSVTDPEGLTTTFTYNAFGDLIVQASPDTGTTSYTYDQAGNRISQTDARGITATYSYDALNRLTAIDYPGAEEDVAYHYDGTNYSTSLENGIGRQTGIEDQSGATTFSYDARGNLITDERVIGGQTYATRYQYDQADNLVGITYPSGRQLNFTRDAVGQVTALEGADGGIASSVSYLPFGPVTGLTLGNGIEISRSYDLDYRLTALADGTLRDKRYSYDPRNQITEIEDVLNTGKTQTFAYDASGRLTEAQGSYGQITYNYDAVGNRITRTIDGLTDAYSYESHSHRLLLAGDTSFSYDAAGNAVTRGDDQLVYNNSGRLTEVNNTATSLYNALGQRVSRTTPAGTIHFHYGQQGQLLAETDGQGRLLREYYYLNGQPVEMFERVETTIEIPGEAVSETQFPIFGALLNQFLRDLGLLPPTYETTVEEDQYALHVDHLGTPQMATDEAGNIVWSADYQPFGQVDVTHDTINVPLRFPGQYADGESGLNYNYFRDYDPEAGRYIQSDPIGLGGGVNTYAYVENNPLSFIDPKGLVQWDGTYFLGSLIIGVGAAYGEFHLTSECLNGERYRVRVVAIGSGGGLSIGDKGLISHIFGRGSVSGGKITFLDHNYSKVDPGVFNGLFDMPSFGFALGPGISVSHIGLGKAWSRDTISSQVGVELNLASGVVGSSTVVSSTKSSCCEQ